MAQTLSELLVRLGVDAGSYYQELDKAQRKNQSWANSWKSIGADIGKATALYATAFGAMVKGQINALDELDEAAQKTGATVEALSRLNYAAGMEGIDDFTATMVKLNKSINDSLDPASEQAQALKAIGVSATDASGKVRGTDAVLMDVAEAFAQAEDGAAKSAIAMALFGKQGAQLIPFLNNGREGLQELTKEADQFGVTASTKAAAAAGEFNDNLYRMGAVVRGAANDIAEGLAPTLAKLTNAMADNVSKGDGLAITIRQIDTGLKLVISSGVIATGVFQAVGKMIGGTAAALGALTTDMKWYHMAPPLAIAKAFQNADLAASAFGAAMEDARGSTTDMFMSLDQVWAKSDEWSKKVGDSAAEAGNNILTFGGADGSKARAKAAADLLKQQEETLRAAAQREEDFRKLQEGFQSEELKARGDYVRRRVEIEKATEADTAERRELMLQAEVEYNGRLAKIREDRDRAEQDLRLKKKQEEELDRQNRDRALQENPLARLAGFGSTDDMARAMDPLKNAAVEFADVANQAFSSAGKSAADLGTELLLTGHAGEDAGKMIAQALVRDVVSGFIQVGIQMVAQKALASMLNAAGTAEVVASQGVIATAAAPAAAMVSLSTLGTNSIPALAAIAAAIAAAGALAIGGGRELGGGVYPGMAHPVTEQDKPELYRRRADGRVFLMPGASGGDVLPMEEHRMGGGSGSGGGGNGGWQIINNAPGLVITPRGRALTIDMVPELLDMIDNDQASRTSSGRGANVRATGQKFGLQPQAVR